MPLVFILLAMAVYLVLGIAALVAALLLAVWPPVRQTARWLAGGVIGSFLFLLFFQGLSLPVIVVIATFFLGVWFGPFNTLNMIIGFGALGLMLVVFVTASVTGLITGWGIGARIASGTPVRDALRASWALKCFAAGLNKLSRVTGVVTPERGIAIGLGIILLTSVDWRLRAWPMSKRMAVLRWTIVVKRSGWQRNMSTTTTTRTIPATSMRRKSLGSREW